MAVGKNRMWGQPFPLSSTLGLEKEKTMNKYYLTLLIPFLLVLSVFSWPKTAKAYRIPNSTIVLDGNLNESIWTTIKADPAAKQTIRAIYEQIDCGKADNDADCSSDFVLIWDDSAFYCGSWFYDDIHYATLSADSNTVLECWRDDSHEWLIDVDWADIVTDQTPEYYGNYGVHIMQGFNLPSREYANYWHDEMGALTGYAATTDAIKFKGFDAPYTTVDGTNFQCEAKFKWNSDFMHNTTNISVAHELAFNLLLNDRDSLNGIYPNCFLKWEHQTNWSFEWGKITLSGAYSSIKEKLLMVAPRQDLRFLNSSNGIEFTSFLEKSGNFNLRIYNIAGRKIWQRNIPNAQAGYNKVTLPSQPFSNSAYIVKVKQNGKFISKRFTVIK
jgi:hypothetical protein